MVTKNLNYRKINYLLAKLVLIKVCWKPYQINIVDLEFYFPLMQLLQIKNLKSSSLTLLSIELNYVFCIFEMIFSAISFWKDKFISNSWICSISWKLRYNYLTRYVELAVFSFAFLALHPSSNSEILKFNILSGVILKICLSNFRFIF